MMIEDALQITYGYLQTVYGKKDARIIGKELLKIVDMPNLKFLEEAENNINTYDGLQELLSKLNEKESIRKSKGVYYTPQDVVRFILLNSIKLLYGRLSEDNISNASLRMIPHNSFAKKKQIFDPTCGAGEFLLETLNIKLDVLEEHNLNLSKTTIEKVVATIHGNDINSESVAISKLRLFLCVLNRYGIKKSSGIADVLKVNFTSFDFVSPQMETQEKYDIIVGNPPYVEDFKSELKLKKCYGNIYANVLANAAALLTKTGVIGFVIPISFVSTPRMKNIRTDLEKSITEQYILSYADRPDCLFNSVHQKLNILIGRKKKNARKIYTGNYQYWYKEERGSLFNETEVIRNYYLEDDFIPKLGNDIDCRIYNKIIKQRQNRSVYEISRVGTERVYLNRRETFWMKAYRTFVADPDYKVFSFETSEEADYCYCLINSSLFWWYWIACSDCWHVSKELNGFRTPMLDNYMEATALASNLMRRLEETKVYVGTKQTQYEYKHKECMEEIHAIDDYINRVYGLTEEEGEYIKNFAIRYRTSGGVANDADN